MTVIHISWYHKGLTIKRSTDALTGFKEQVASRLAARAGEARVPGVAPMFAPIQGGQNRVVILRIGHSISASMISASSMVALIALIGSSAPMA